MDWIVWLGALPFVAMLLGIALIPMISPRHWEHPAAPYLLSFGCALPVVLGAPFMGKVPELLEGIGEYIAFIALIAALYVTAGGIHISGNLRATPRANVTLLGVGAVAASLIGTTGASMLLIRPLLHANIERRHKQHLVVFFILLVSNVGGLLTPLGDPPLYLGYLSGVPFSFPLRLWPMWLLAVSFLLAVCWIWDSRAYAREALTDLARDAAHATSLRLHGRINLLVAAGIIAASAGGVPHPWREIVFAGLIGLSLALTPHRVRQANAFHYGPLKEVAILFIGIFITMLPAVEALKEVAPSLPVDTASGLFFMTGGLSSVLDNAPTYLVFASLAAARAGLGTDIGLLASHAPNLLAAISVGAVFMGANTYIGNGPNLLVKAVAEGGKAARVEMPSFLGYAVMATAILAPVYVLVPLLLLH